MTSPSNLSIKQQRDARRSEKVAKQKQQRAQQKRAKRIGIASAIVGSVAVVALVVTVVVINATPRLTPDEITIAGVTNYPSITAVHVDPVPVDYEAKYGMTPPAGGDHFGAWLNCGTYDQPQQDENAVHSLEHGALWVTYDPDALDDSEVATLRSAMPRTYVILSPYPGLPAPVVASSWGNQIELTGADDPNLDLFIQKFWKSADAPEPGALCTGALDGPGRVS
ncbi:MAG: DUF3105 domain-containing protein [Rhodoglobus sp.]|nr:DUF3105 domain-containing protein [Rhodoglobus sp.]